MTRRRWIADEVYGDRAALLGGHAEHLARVLRARVGQEFDVVAEGRVRRARISGLSTERIELELAEDVAAPPLPPVDLFLAIIKFDRFEWAVEKATELGVARIVPIIARRTDTHLAGAATKRVERWRRIARESSEQSRRAQVPAIADPTKTYAALEQARGARVVLAESEERTTLRQALTSAVAPVTLAIGPEGGWTNDELARFAGAGWISASLGATILRAETAAIAALAIAVSELSSPE